MLLNFKEYVYREHWRGDPLRVTSHAACSPLSQSRFDASMTNGSILRFADRTGGLIFLLKRVESEELLGKGSE